MLKQTDAGRNTNAFPGGIRRDLPTLVGARESGRPTRKPLSDTLCHHIRRL